MLGVSYAMAENTFAVTQTAPDRPVARFHVDGAAFGALDGDGFKARHMSARGVRAMGAVGGEHPRPPFTELLKMGLGGH